MTSRPRTSTRAVAVTVVIIAIGLLAGGVAAGEDGRTRAAPPYLSTGALLASGTTTSQTCTATVVDSVGGDIVVTAAHCLSGLSGQARFAPGYRPGKAPIGMWSVRSFYTSPAWDRDADPDADYAFLVVDPIPATGAHGSVQAAAGGDRLGLAPTGGDRVEAIGYPIQLAGIPLECDVHVRTTAEFPTLDCPGYTAGTSGGPLLTHFDPAKGTGTIVGVIGGLDTGGCTADVSYASPFSAATRSVLLRAETGAPTSRVPMPPRASSC